MEEQFAGRDLRIHPPELIVKVAAAALGMLALFLLILSISHLKEFRFIGSGVAATNTITVSGSGEVFAVPDTGAFNVTIRENAKEVADAQENATKKTNTIIDYLKGAGVDEKDIKTVDYSINPKYEWTQGVCTSAGYCPPGKQVLDGFEVSQTITVKVRDTKKAGDLLSGVGTRGASEVSGLSFTTDDDDKLKSDAREKAIADAKGKAEELAQQLGVKLVRVVGFYEDSGPMPYYSAYGKGGIAMDAMPERASSPSLPVGENKLTSNVNVTYEIK